MHFSARTQRSLLVPLKLTGAVMLSWLAVSCAGSPPPAKNAAPPQVAAAPTAAVANSVPSVPKFTPLRVGSVGPALQAEVAGKVTGYFRDADTETFRVEVPGDAFAAAVHGSEQIQLSGEWSLGAFAAGAADAASEQPVGALWLRRKLGTAADTTLKLKVVWERSSRETVAFQTPVKVDVGALPKPNPRLEQDFFRALDAQLRVSPILSLFHQSQPGVAAAPSVPDKDPLGELIASLSGEDSIEAALQQSSILDSKAGAATLPIAGLQGPQLPPHDWPKLMQGLNATAAQPKPSAAFRPDALAAFTPSDFFYVATDPASQWLSLLDGSAFRGGLAAQGKPLTANNVYLEQLGLSDSKAQKSLADNATAIAVVGSDAALDLGSDLTLVLALKAASDTATLAAELSGNDAKQVDYKGISLYQNSTPPLRRFVARAVPQAGAAGLLLVSNSEPALKRVLDVIVDKKGALAGEADFRYMVARDPITRPVFAYVGDAFVRRVVAPETRIGNARRALYRRELQRPGFATLLFAWLKGRDPKDSKELFASRWLNKAQLKHRDGAAIDFEPSSGATSRFGRAEFLTPLIELPAVTRVSSAEREAYAAFRSNYESLWRTAIDPITLQFAPGNASTPGSFELRVLPQLSSGEVRGALEAAGNVRIAVPPLTPGAQVSVGISPESDLRRWLTAQGSSLLEKTFHLDWLGSWLALGLADTNSVPELARQSDEIPEIGNAGSARNGFPEGPIPLYIALEVKNRAALAVLLSAARKAVRDALGDSVTWNEFEKYGSASVIKVAVDDFSLYFSMTRDRLFLSGDLHVLHALLHAAEGSASPAPGMAARAPTAVPKATEQPSGGFQAAFSLQNEMPRSSPLLTALLWLLEASQREWSETHFDLANALLRGSPQTAPNALSDRGRKLIGVVARTPEGEPYTLSETGVTDPARGSRLAPVYSALPLPNSGIEAFVTTLLRLRIDVGFDTEPDGREQSFHTRGTWQQVQ